MPKYYIRLTDIFHLAADYALNPTDDPNHVPQSDTPFYEYWRYSCDAAQAVVRLLGHQRYTFDSHQLHRHIDEKLHSFGVNPCGYKEFSKFEAGEERQGARYLWLKFVALVVGDEVYEVPQEVFQAFNDLMQKAGYAPEYSIPLAELVRLAANYYLREHPYLHDQTRRCETTEYSCNALEWACDRLKLPSDVLKLLMNELVKCGLPNVYAGQFEDIYIQDRQGVRYLWMMMFAEYLEDEDMLVVVDNATYWSYINFSQEVNKS